MLITDVQDMDKKRKKIYIDYEYAFFLYNSEIRKYNIVSGTELSEKVYHEINEELVAKRAKARALYILKGAQKTKKQLLDKLVAGGYSIYHAKLAVEYASSFGYIDDLQYARYFVDMSCKGRSRRDIEGRLYQRGIDKDIISQVLSETDRDEEGAIWQALRKKSVTMENLSELDFEQKNRLFGYLMRKGFSMDCINKVLHTEY